MIAKDEMKNRISMALKSPVLQQGFEIICRENVELEKENAELKEKVKPENCLKLLAKEGYIKFTNDQLTKAKEIIFTLLDNFAYPIEREDWTVEDVEIVDKAEQFLKEADE